MLSKNNNFKKCERCSKTLPYSKFYTVSKKNNKPRPYCKKCHSILGLIYKFRKKLRIVKNHFEGKCHNCNNNFLILPALQFHHTQPDIKTKSWRRIYGLSESKIIKRFREEGVILLCSNCHLKKQATIFNEYRDLILKKNLFSLETKEINKKIFMNTDHISEKLDRMHIRQKIREWIKKRFIIEQLYDGKCIGCEGVNIFNNLPALEFHHKIGELKEDKIKWNKIEHMKSIDIMNILIEQRCICLCSNCHSILHSRFIEFVKEIMRNIFNSNQIEYFKDKIRNSYKSLVYNIQKYNPNETNLSFRNPLILKVPHTDRWKIHISKIYSYLNREKKITFGAYELVEVLSLTPRHVYKHLNRFIKKGYIRKEKEKNGKFWFTDQGIKKVSHIDKFLAKNL